MAETVKATLAENFGGVAQKAAPEGTKFSLDDIPDLTGKVAVVTGGSEGIGYGCTHTLLSKNISKVFVLSVSQEVVDGATNSIKEELGEDMANRTKWIQCDLSDWKHVAEVAQEINNSTDRLDILINNAARGIMTYQVTDYGVERHMAVNHMGHVVLTSNLLPLLKKTAENNTVRIVNLSSNAHPWPPEDIKFDSLEDLNTDFGPRIQYGRSKLAAILYSRYLAQHLTKEHPKILINATHPGFVDTKMSTDDIHEAYPLGGYGMSAGLQPFKKNQFEGALSTMYAATQTDKSGEYLCVPAIPEPGSKLSQSQELAEQLMKLTRELVAEKTNGGPLKDY